MNRQNVEDLYSLSPLQEGMLFHTLYAPEAYAEQAVVTLRGNLRADAWERAWQTVLDRHPALRTGFVWQGLPKPVQFVYKQATLPTERVDLRDLPEEERRARVQAFLEADKRRGYELGKPPLIRVALLRTRDDEHVFVLSSHHLLFDGWSMPIILGEADALYHAYLRGETPQLPARRPFREYVLWLAKQSAAAAEAHWRHALAGFAEPTPLWGDRAPHRAGKPAETHGAVSMTLDAGLSSSLRDVAKRGVTLNTLAQAAWALVLARAADTDDVVYGATVSGRPGDLPGVEGMVGMFINTVPVRVQVPEEGAAIDWLARLQRQQAEARQFEHSPLVQVQGWSEVPRDRPLFESLLVVENYPLDRSEGGEPDPDALEVVEAHGTEETNYALTLTLVPGDTVVLRLSYDAERFDDAGAGRLLAAVRDVLAQLAADPGRPAGSLSILGDEERRRILLDWNQTASEYPRDATIHALFEACAAAAPDDVALVHEGETTTYAELNARANRLARLLRARGVGEGARVGMAIDRSPEAVVTMLATLKAGGAYLPLDLAYPAERLRFMAEDAECAALVVRDTVPDALAGFGGAVVSLAADRAAIGAESAESLEAGATAESPAYVIYTSGSTGKPKGVVAAHRGVVRLVRDSNVALFGPSHVVLHASPVAFDASTLEIYGALLNGARLVVLPARTPALEELGGAIRREGVTLAWLTVGLFNQMVDERPQDLAGLDQLVTGGDAASVPHVRRALERLPGVLLTNGYGPTENTTFTTRHFIRAEDAERASIPIGEPVSNTRVYVVDSRFRPVPVGVAGELVTAGDGLAIGYVGRDELTAEKFVTVDFGGGLVERVYRTGDRARWLEEGTLEFLGRADAQVKLRGFRVEPGEIEALLAAHPTVGAASVIAREDLPGDRRLVAYLTPRDGARPDVAALREEARAVLPEYMVPAAFVTLDALPLTANGKVDRRALPAPEWTGDAEFEAPRGGVEEVLAGIWSALLGVERVGRHDSFFLLGGHSLIATQLASRLRQAFGVEMPLRAVFEAPRLNELAARVAEAMHGGASAAAAPPLLRRDDAGPAPASFAQERLWLVDRLQPGTSAYNMPGVLRVTGALDAAALERSLGEIVRRHEPLRTVFSVEDGKPVQTVHDGGGFVLPVEDLTHLPESDREAEARRRADEEATAPFDLERGPLFRARLLRLADERHVLLFTLHHVTSDGWSIGVLVRELTALYDAFSRGLPSPLPELPVRYRDFARWQREWLSGEVLEAQTAYWREALAGAPPLLELPADRPRPALESFRGASSTFVIPAEVAGRVRALAKKDDATLFMALLSAFQLLLSRWSGQDDVVVGTPIAGRTRVETEGLIGLFINTLVLRGDLSGDPTFRALLGRSRQATLGAYAHQDVPFERLVEELAPERSLAHHPVFQVMFSLQNTPGEALELGGLEIEVDGAELGTSRFDLSLSLTELAGGGLHGQMEYATDLFDASTADRLARHYTRLLEAAAAAPEAPVSTLSLLDVEERETVLRRFNDTATEYPRDATVHGLFAEVAAAAPNDVALACQGETTTYRDLDAKSNRLARVLRLRGVGAGTRVGMAVARSAETIVSMLAILKAGGAYVPLDAGYPAERLRYMLEDSGATVLLVRDEVPEALRGFGGAVVSLAADRAEIDRESGDELASDASAESLAYLMYTSGSTGKPKGVMIPHRGIVRLSRNTSLADFGPHHVVLQASSIAFDAATLEIYGALLNGARLVVLPAETPSLEALGATLREHSVTLAWLSVGMFNQMVDERPGDLAALRQLCTGGDAASVPHVRRALERLPHVQLVNGYGPTENTSLTTRHLVRAEDADRASIPIGRPLSNTRVYIVDAKLQPVPAGVPGELVAAGDGLALGYAGRDDLTAEKFVTVDFGNGLVERVYRTGDRARWLDDGTVEFLGRVDTQVKLRGYRIEPGEVEAALAAQPGVDEAAVVVREDVPGDRRLVAYVTPSGGDRPEPAVLREAVRAALPEYMVPAAVLVIGRIPLTPNGKVDRRALPAPEWASEERYVAPRSEAEARLAEIFAGVLRVERVGIDDGFFHLGGHSLLATQAVSRIRQALGVELPLRALFEAPTVRALAARIGDEAAPTDADEIRPVPRDGVLLPSFSQERTWFFERMGGGKSVYNMPAPLRLSGPLDVEALERAVSEIVRRHESLRTRFRDADGRPVLVIDPPFALSLDPLDLSGLPEAEARAEADRRTREDIGAPFDLERGPLFRARLLRIAADEHVLLLNFHHSISDGWSMGIFLREMTALYEAFAKGVPSPLPELALQYADVVQWQRSRVSDERLAGQLAYWKERLSGAPPLLTLPTDFPRPPVQEHIGAAATALLPRALLDDLHALSRREGMTLAMTLLAAFQLLLGRLAGQDDVVVGAPIAGRTRPEMEPLIGLFLGTLALRTRLDGNPTFAALVGRARETLLGAQANQEVPWARVLEALEPERSLAWSPVFQVMFNMLNFETASGEAGGLAIESLAGSYDYASKLDLTMYLQERPDGLSVDLLYDASLFAPERMAEMLRQFRRLLEQAAAAPDTPVDALSLVTEEAERLLPDPAAPLPAEWRGSVPSLFARHARMAPEAVAAEDPAERWTYAELDRASSRIAQRLVGGGVRPGNVVAVYAHRSAALVRALLGILKGGGAFLVLDPAYPAARLAEYVRIAQPRALLHLAAAGELPAEVADALRGSSVSTVVLGAKGSAPPDELDGLGRMPASAPPVEIGPDSLAYLSFTSGTTGVPKAVMGRHGSLTHFTPWLASEFGLGASDRFSLLSGLAHDPLHRDVFTPLQLGASVVAPDPEQAGAPGYLAGWMREAGVTVAHLTPAMGQLVTSAAEGERVPSLRRAFFVGDVLRRGDVERLVRLAPNVTVVNYYGSTETQRAVGFHVVRPGAERAREIVPLGRGIPGVQLLVRGAGGGLAGVGEVGEVWMRSPHVALGYLNDGRLTSERFVHNPWTGAEADRLYRTGDLGRYLPDGEVEPLGRADGQVKVRGFRVELGEIEGALLSHSAVREAAVLARDGAGGRMLVAYLVLDGAPEAAELRAHLGERLPDFMVPAAFVALEALPMTANGKLDRRALPDPSLAAAEEAYVAPRTAVESLVAELWAEVLEQPRVGVHDNFFALGGHSLLATRLLSRVEQAFGAKLPLRVVFERPTVAGLAEALEESAQDVVAEMDDALEGLSDEEIAALLADE